MSPDHTRGLREESRRLDRCRYDDRRPGLLRTKAVYSLAQDQPDPAADWLEEGVATTEGTEQALLRSDLAAVLLARSWSDWRGRPGYFPRGDDLFRAVDLAAQALEVIPDLREAQFNLALSLQAIGLRETPKEEWRRYLTLDPSSPWAKEAREHLRQLSIPIPIQERPNALHPEGPLDDADPAVRLYLAGRGALRDQRYDEARAAFRQARTLWWERDPRMAGWATYRLALCDYFDPEITPHDGPHGDGPHVHIGEVSVHGTIYHACGIPRVNEQSLAPLLKIDDPELVARTSYLLASSTLPLFDAIHALGAGLAQARRTRDLDLIARLESVFSDQLEGDANRAGWHHLAALHASLSASSPRTRDMALEGVADWSGNSGHSRAATLVSQERSRWSMQKRQDLHPLSHLQAVLRTSGFALSSRRLDIARQSIVQASRELLGISDPWLRSVLWEQVVRHEMNIHIDEQEELYGRHRRFRSIPTVAQAIDRDRFAPELLRLGAGTNSCRTGNLWFLAQDLHRAIDHLEGRSIDIPVLRQIEWVSVSPFMHLRGHSFRDPVVGVFGAQERNSRGSSFPKTALVYPSETREEVRITINAERGSLPVPRMRMNSFMVAEYLRDWYRGIRRPSSARFRSASEGLMRDFGVAMVQGLFPSVGQVGIVSSHGNLDYLPLAAIRDPHSGRFLVELFEMFVLPEYSAEPEKYFSQSIEPSLPPLAEATRARAIGTFLTRRSASEPRVLLVVGSASAKDPDALMGAEKEVEELARRFPNHRILRGAEATKERVLAELQTATITHFAAHGWVDDSYPDETGLILGPGERGGVRLTVGDLRKLHAPNLRLVVLSTCNSARATTSPESFSLASAFIFKGVPAVVASLASIQDRSAPRFFNGFYSHLDESGDPIKALRSAQLDFVRGPEAERTLQIWAPYVVMVNPGFRFRDR